MKAKNVLFIIPEMSMGGAQRSLTNISNELASYYNIFIVVFNLDHDVSVSHSGKLLSLDVVSGRSLRSKLTAFYKRVRRLSAIKKKYNIDVAISFLEGADYINVLSKGKEKVILSIRGSKLHDENMHRENFFVRKRIISALYRKADAIICVNNGIALEMKDTFNIKRVPLHVINNFYNAVKINEMAAVPLSDNERRIFNFPVMAMSGRLAREKGNLFILKVFKSLIKEKPDLRLVFIGDGPLREEIIALCKDSGISYAFREFSGDVPSVFITGEVRNVFQYLVHAKLYLLNSSSEGFPNGLAEAMACGVAVMSADCPYGPREILTHDVSEKHTGDVEYASYGVLLPMLPQDDPSSVKIWSEAITSVLTNDAYRTEIGKTAKLRIADFSTENIIRQWRNVIDQSSSK